MRARTASSALRLGVEFEEKGTTELDVRYLDQVLEFAGADPRRLQATKRLLLDEHEGHGLLAGIDGGGTKTDCVV